MQGLNLISQNRDGNSSFYLFDGHSGVRQLSDELGVVTDTYKYDAYGSLLASTGDTENGYLYRGEQFDAHVDLQYLRARYYNPSLGRFASVDPFEGMLEQPMSRHRYLYGNDNPVSFEDPSGKSALTVYGSMVSHMMGTLATSFQALGTVGLLTLTQQSLGIIGSGLTGTLFVPDVEWNGGVVGGSASITPVNPIGLRMATLTSEPFTFGGTMKNATGRWLIVSGGYSVGFPVSLTVGLLNLTSPAAVGVNLFTLSGGFLAASASITTAVVVAPVTIGVSAVSMGFGRGFAFPDISFGIDTSASVVTGLSIPIQLLKWDPV